eukprot:TRINITY_DN7470_c0_g1_i1.p1 TRINITY_DN7470_c0_g1~~TRINITY_DN7470_c0_g1_i1.p1  ORF type:complete len:847 (-),score=184.42 TRINITY_DN7470_c0_g1_i1:146-2602(-)
MANTGDDGLTTNCFADVNRVDLIIKERLDKLARIDDNICTKQVELEDLSEALLASRKEIDEQTTTLSRLAEQITLKKQVVGKTRGKVQRVNFEETRFISRAQENLYIVSVSGWQCFLTLRDFQSVAEAESATQKISVLEELDLSDRPPLANYLNHDCEGKSVRVFFSQYSTGLGQVISRWCQEKNVLVADDIQRLATMVAEGLVFLHKNGVVHRQVCPENMFASVNTAGDIIELHLSVDSLARRDDQWPLHLRKARRYSAPEVVGTSVTSYSYASDVYSFGMLLYTLLTLKPPFEEELDVEKVHSLIAQGKKPKFPASLLSLASPETPVEKGAQTVVTFDSAGDEESVVVVSADQADNSLVARHYRNLLDLFEVCTSTQPAMRPDIATVYRALNEESESIKSWWRPPQEEDAILLRKWLTVSQDRTSALDRSSAWPEGSMNLCVCPDGFVAEVPGQPEVPSSLHLSESYKQSSIMFWDQSTHFYERYLCHRPHENFVHQAMAPTGDDLAIISLESTPISQDSGRFAFRALIRTVPEDIRLVITCDSAKDRLKALKNHPIMNKYRPNLERVKDDSFRQKLQKLERDLAEQSRYKFGIIYRKRGQVSDDDMLSNRSSSRDLSSFLDFLGDKIRLKGWNRFRGGLDISGDTTGKFSYYTSLLLEDSEFEIVFHVSTLLPFMADNPQQLARKRHIGNDVVVLIFQDEDADPFTPQDIASHFNHAFVVVQPIKKDGCVQYAVNVLYKDSVTLKPTPDLPAPAIFDRDDEFRHFILTKMINAERVAMKGPSFSRRLAATRKAVLTDCVQTQYTGKRKKHGSNIH